MATAYDSSETWDRLVLLLAARPRDGWEEVFEDITHRELERLAPYSQDGNQKGSSPTKTRTPKTLPNQGAK